MLHPSQVFYETSHKRWLNTCKKRKRPFKVYVIMYNFSNWQLICEEHKASKYSNEICMHTIRFDQTFHQFYDLDTELDLHRIMSGFHRAFATGVAYQQGTLTLPDTWFRPPFWDLLVLQWLRPDSSNLPCLYSTFHLEYPLVLSRFCLTLVSHRKVFIIRHFLLNLHATTTYQRSENIFLCFKLRQNKF